MFSKAAFSGPKGAQPQHIDPIRPSSSQEHGGRKSLLERLKADTPAPSGRGLNAAPNEPRYVDVTAAFFARQKPKAPQVQSSTQSHHVPPRHGPLFPEKVLQKQTRRSPPDEPQTPESPLASDLRDNIAAEGNTIYRNGSASLNDIYEALKSAMVECGIENDRTLAMIESHQKKTLKPLSETRLKEIVMDENDEVETSSYEIQIGKAVDTFHEQIQTLETELVQLWDTWDEAEREVQNMLASVTGDGDERSAGQADAMKDVHKSLAHELERFDGEFVGIIQESHEAAKMSERDFSKKINGVMNALLQQYLLGD